jgi:hypothetical protein
LNVRCGAAQVERGDLMSAYYRRLTGTDEAVRRRCAAAWTEWECSTSRLEVDAEMVKKATDDVWAYAFARIEWYDSQTNSHTRVVLPHQRADGRDDGSLL